MSRPWRSAFFLVLLISTVGVFAWAGVLAFSWYEGYTLGKLIATDVTADQHPATGLKGSQSKQEWQALEKRKTEVADRIIRLGEWQQNVGLTTAFDAWRACSPRPEFGTHHFWKLLSQHGARNFMELMLDEPMPEFRRGLPAGPSLIEAVAAIAEESKIPLWSAGPDRPLTGDSHVPMVGQRFRDELDSFATSNGLRWELIDQLVVFGTTEELADFHRRSESRGGRIEHSKNSIVPTTRMIAEKLIDPITLEFTETPISDILDFMRDYTQVNILLLPGHSGEVAVSIHLQQVSLGLAFDCLFMQVGLDWDVVVEVLAIGTADELAKFNKRVEARRDRIARLRLSNNPGLLRLVDKLAEPVTLQFLSTPLNDVMDFLTDYSGVCFVGLPGDAAENGGGARSESEQHVSVHVEQISLAMALDCLCEENGLEWEVIDQLVAVGHVDRVHSFRPRSDESDCK